jgi:hypothetical protein
VSLGAPPDPFSRQGQVWNLPPFSPLALAETGFQTMTDILGANMRHAAALRIDHILGYARQFWVPRGAAAGAGAYVRFPAEVLIALTAVESRRHACIASSAKTSPFPMGCASLGAFLLSGLVRTRGIEFSRRVSMNHLPLPRPISHLHGWRWAVTSMSMLDWGISPRRVRKANDPPPGSQA